MQSAYSAEFASVVIIWKRVQGGEEGGGGRGDIGSFPRKLYNLIQLRI